MIKKIFLALFLVISANAYISIDQTYNSSGGGSATGGDSDFYLKMGISKCTNTECSSIWRYNATTTENEHLNISNKFLNNEIFSKEKYQVKKGLTETQFIKNGINFFKNEDLEGINNQNTKKYNIFQLIRKVPATETYNETITKSSNSFSISTQNKENTTIHLNSETVFNSYLFGQVETNLGLVTGYIYRNRILTIDKQKYHLIELERINFIDNLVNKYNRYCANPINTNFPFIYDPYNFYYSYLEQKDSNFTNAQNFSVLAYPTLSSNISAAVKTGLISLPCSASLMGSDPYNKISNLSGIIDKNKITYYDGYPDYGKDSILEISTHYFENNGFSLRINQLDPTHIFNMGVSFLNSVMQDRKIESGFVVKSKRFKVTNKYWKAGKCPRHFNRKTLTSQNSEVYFLSSLINNIPFNEEEANFNITSSLKLSSYSPIPAFPSNEDGIYSLTPDNHILTHSINTVDNILIKTLGLTTGNHLQTTDNIVMTKSWQQHCSSFGFFSFLLLIVAIVVTVVSAGAAAGLWSAGGLFASVGSATGALVSGTSIAATSVAFYGAIGAYLAYSSLWSGITTNAGTINKYNYQQELNILEKVSGSKSGSSFYLDFLNLEDTLNNRDNKNYAISPKEYNAITAKSLILQDGHAISGLDDTQILGLGTSKEVDYLNSLFYSHANPATLPPGFRYFSYHKVPFDPLVSSTYTWDESRVTSNAKYQLNASLLENHLLYSMAGYNLNNAIPNGKFDLFKTYFIMNTILSKYNNDDISKYEN